MSSVIGIRKERRSLRRRRRRKRKKPQLVVLRRGDDEEEEEDEGEEEEEKEGKEEEPNWPKQQKHLKNKIEFLKFYPSSSNTIFITITLSCLHLLSGLLLSSLWSPLIVQSVEADSCINETSDSCLPSCQDSMIDSLYGASKIEINELKVALSRYYKLPAGFIGAASGQVKPIAPQEARKSSSIDSTAASDDKASQGAAELDELPRPSNLSVLVISWYPPVLRLTWDLHELSESRAKQLNFYSSASGEEASSSGIDDDNDAAERSLAAVRRRTMSSSSHNAAEEGGSSASEKSGKDAAVSSSLLGQIDLALLGQPADSSGEDASSRLLLSGHEEAEQNGSMPMGASEKAASELKLRRLLVRRALTCFQVTYNIINSRFKITEEYPPYLRSILLERLLPATEYSLQVAAIYLNRHRMVSERVQFVSPTDNESRRFKENTYRPIQHYPDSKPQNVRYGLAQVRSEELTIVAIALLFWVATICLFFNKWGKIRMLEPYQPAYREETDSPAPFAAHHHPSLLNLASSAVGSAGTGGSGPALTGPQVVAATERQLSTECEQQQQRQVSGIPDLTGKSRGHSDGALSCSPGPPKGVAVAAAPAMAPHPVRVALANCKRFESVASSNDSSAALMHARRTDAELNFLFQSKAHILAKATSLWSRQQQQQKLRQQQHQQQQQQQQQQYWNPAQQHAELEILRRTSQALLHQRQRQMSTCSPIAAAGTLDPSVPHSSVYSAQSVSCAPLSQVAGAASNSAGLSAQFVCAAQESAQQHRMPANCARSQSLEQQYQQQTVSTAAEATGNKLRRLLFMSKSHQHQHIATSTSSSTLINLQQLNSLYSTSIGSGNNNNISSSRQMNSVSLDAASSVPTTQPQRSPNQSQQPGSAAPDQDASDASELANGPHRATFRQTSTESAPPSGPLNSLGLDLSCGAHMRARSSTLGRTGGLGVAAATSAAAAAAELHHHILIEPPSPPNPRELNARELASYREQERRAWGPPTSGQPVRADEQPVPKQQLVKLLIGREQAGDSHDVGLPSDKRTGDLGAGSSSSPRCDEQVEQLERQKLLASQDHSLDNKQRQGARIEGEMTDSDSRRRDLFPGQMREQRHGHDNHYVLASNRQAVEQQQRPAIPLSSSSASLRNLSAKGAGTTTSSRPASGCSSMDPSISTYQQQRRASSFTSAGHAGSPNNSGAPAIRLENSSQCQQLPLRDQQRGRDAFARLEYARKARSGALDSALQLDYHQTSYCSPVDAIPVTGADCPSRRHQSFCAGDYAYLSSLSSLPAPHMPDRLDRPKTPQLACSSQNSQQCLQCALIQLASGGNTGNLCWNHLHCQQQSHHEQQLCALEADAHSRAALCGLQVEQAGSGGSGSGTELGLIGDSLCTTNQVVSDSRPRLSSVFASSPYSRTHRGSFTMLRALSQKKSKSAEDVAYLSSLVLQIWVRERNPLLQSVSQQHLHHQSASKRLSNPREVPNQHISANQRPKTSLTVSHL